MFADGLSHFFQLGRLKTGTPPRLDRDSLDFGAMEEQWGDPRPQPFSFETDGASFPQQPQVPCHLTWTNGATHKIIQDNVHLSPMVAGRIEGIGPRYCPSVEDKIIRFADKDRHQVFVEPEGLSTPVIYVNGVSTSLPTGVQEAFVRTIPGLEKARFLQHGYAVEYDFVMPHQLDASLALRQTPGLFLAGQINGTSGYEEAAAQGLIAGANAAKWIQDEAPFVLGRHQAYIGVMVDDLILTSPTEPYRMFSSRAEHRLLLRQDNANRRLVPLARDAGLVGDAALEQVLRFEEQLKSTKAILKQRFVSPSRSLLDYLRRERGMSMILITHDLGVVKGRADDIMVMYGGRTMEQADTATLFAEMRHPYTEALLEAIPRIDAPSHSRLVPIPGKPPDAIDVPSGCPFAARCRACTDACLVDQPALTAHGATHQAPHQTTHQTTHRTTHHPTHHATH